MTYCSKHKVENTAGGSNLFFPSQLYTSRRVQAFVRFCESHGYTWAIFSDQYGLVSDNEKIEWYNKPPNGVTDEEYESLLRDTIIKLNGYDDVIFFYEYPTFHPLYRKLTNDLKQHKRVVLTDSLENWNVE